jgi:hypothetical protein
VRNRLRISWELLAKLGTELILWIFAVFD